MLERWKDRDLVGKGLQELESERILLLDNAEGQLLRGERIWGKVSRWKYSKKAHEFPHINLAVFLEPLMC